MVLPIVFPDIFLPSTDGIEVNLSHVRGCAVLFIYPYTGRSGFPDPEGWDHIPGAHGSTPQALAYKALFPKFSALGIQVFGMSLQDAEWQCEFVTRNSLPFSLLSDAAGMMTKALALKSFTAGKEQFLERRTLVLERGRVVLDRSDIPAPALDAEAVLNWIVAR